MPKRSLYFIAILPPSEIGEQITLLRTECAERFDSRQALKSPPHITLQQPFMLRTEDKIVFEKALAILFEKFKAFNVVLKNFECFSGKHNPVIFIKPLENDLMNILHYNLMLFLRNLGFDEKITRLAFHPHITIAYRDLSNKNFKRAWIEFEERIFNAAFTVNTVYLMCHDRKTWQPVKSFVLEEGGAA
ncbi:MAG: 2'-5' RNA ligase family protein [Parafilimonas sp.]